MPKKRTTQTTIPAGKKHAGVIVSKKAYEAFEETARKRGQTVASRLRILIETNA